MQYRVIAIAILAFFVGVIAAPHMPAPQFAQANALTDFFSNLFNGETGTSTPWFPALPSPPTASVPVVPLTDYEQALISAVERAEPAVVSVIISKNLPIIEQCPYNPFGDLPQEFHQFFGQGFQFTQPCQRGTRRQEVGGGSGFIISSDGLIATNRHVVSDEDASYTVLTNDGKKHEAKVLAGDPFWDFAVIKIDAKNLPVLPLGSSAAMKLGQPVIAIGNALGEFRNTVSVGVISGLARNIVASGGGNIERIEGVFQTDTAINQGNSGGPLLNVRGEVIGVNVATVSGAQNIGFAIPIDQLKGSIESVKATGKISVPFLGVRYIVVTPEVAERESLAVDYGVLLRGNEEGPAVVINSPAQKAGLQAEDIILEVEGEKITPANSLAGVIRKHRAGDAIALKILRNGQELAISVMLAERAQ